MPRALRLGRVVHEPSASVCSACPSSERNATFASWRPAANGFPSGRLPPETKAIAPCVLACGEEETTSGLAPGSADRTSSLTCPFVPEGLRREQTTCAPSDGVVTPGPLREPGQVLTAEVRVVMERRARWLTAR